MRDVKNEEVGMRGEVLVRVIRQGQVVHEERTRNLVVNAGKNAVAGLFYGETGVNPFRYVAVGTGTTAPTVNDTALQSEITGSGLARTLATCSRTNNEVTLVASWNVTGSVTVSESGIFNAASGGTMFARVTFAGLPLVNGDYLELRWKVTVG